MISPIVTDSGGKLKPWHFKKYFINIFFLYLKVIHLIHWVSVLRKIRPEWGYYFHCHGKLSCVSVWPLLRSVCVMTLCLWHTLPLLWREPVPPAQTSYHSWWPTQSSAALISPTVAERSEKWRNVSLLVCFNLCSSEEQEILHFATRNSDASKSGSIILVLYCPLLSFAHSRLCISWVAIMEG